MLLNLMAQTCHIKKIKIKILSKNGYNYFWWQKLAGTRIKQLTGDIWLASYYLRISYLTIYMRLLIPSLRKNEWDN